MTRNIRTDMRFYHLKFSLLQLFPPSYHNQGDCALLSFLAPRLLFLFWAPRLICICDSLDKRTNICKALPDYVLLLIAGTSQPPFPCDKSHIVLTAGLFPSHNRINAFVLFCVFATPIVPLSEKMFSLPLCSILLVY